MACPAEERYTATCCTVGCGWEQICETQYQALVAARQHEHVKELHLTIVVPPVDGIEAAWFLHDNRLDRPAVNPQVTGSTSPTLLRSS